MSPEAPSYSLSDVLIHDDIMRLLDDVFDFQEKKLSASVSITSDSEFLNEDNEIPAWVGIEYMAQTIAAWAGITHRNRGNVLKKGYLLGTRKFTAHVTHFSLNSELTIFIEKVYEGDDLGVFDCSITAADKLLAEASLNVYQPQ
ncbi:3-hydroxydecanoyl-[ACP] dehydratase [hydrothermal vent metagenome]|uniref:3-hydroxydecanoyl-[ACP] dehydratase n=1 Tax=hydrothermal vent metagenome TaxID=652676 RepID=A0A3B0X1Z2_9ZZZZ